MPNAHPLTPAPSGLPTLPGLPPLPIPILPPSQPHPRPWHKGGLFGTGPRRAMSEAERRAWLSRVHDERRAGRLTALHAEVGRSLVRRLGADGQCDPAHATLAKDTPCGERTVRRALAALRGLGLLTWQQRLVRRPWPAGGPGATRAEQTSNAYVLLLPREPVALAETRRSCRVQGVRRAAPPRAERTAEQGAKSAGGGADCGGQDGRETPQELIQRAGLVVPSAAEQTRMAALMAQRKADREAEWHRRRLERWQGGN